MQHGAGFVSEMSGLLCRIVRKETGHVLEERDDGYDKRGQAGVTEGSPVCRLEDDGPCTSGRKGRGDTLEQRAQRSERRSIEACGDTPGDLPMMAWVSRVSRRPVVVSSMTSPVVCKADRGQSRPERYVPGRLRMSAAGGGRSDELRFRPRQVAAARCSRCAVA